MRSVTKTALSAALVLAAAGAAGAARAQSAPSQTGTHAATQPGTPAAMPQVKEAKPGLLRQATVTPDAATRTALARVPNGRVQDAEIEEEHGKLVYSYDLKVPGKSGIDEVLVDAKTGAVVSHSHESPAAERAEARKDARAARKAAHAKGEKGESGEKGETPGDRR